MALQIYNSLTRKKELFTPIHEGFVGIYVCGPTVYDESHIGHGRTYVNFDTLVRYLRYKGYKVRYVQNITDVGHILDTGEDRILKGARRERLEPMEVVERYTRLYFEDMDTLNVQRPDISPRASGHIPEQIELVKLLLAKGFAYEANGSVYFDVPKWEGYGKLSGRKVEDLIEGARVEVREEKRSPVDFALWKRAEPEHIMRWPSPWGEGFPGWHLECTVMSSKYLGLPFDIHGGGMDNKFPHHESEVAQAEAAYGDGFANIWIHNGMLMIRGEEMHKSLGNFVTLKQAYTVYDPMAIRLFILMAHYRSPVDLTDEAMQAATAGLGRIYDLVRELRWRLERAPEGEANASTLEMLAGHRARFDEAMDDDFNTPQAVAVLFDLTREANALFAGETLNRGDLATIHDLVMQLAGSVLGLRLDQLTESAGGNLAEGLMQLLIELRADYRAEKDWKHADALRDRLAALGVVLKDGSEGTRWTVERRP